MEAIDSSPAEINPRKRAAPDEDSPAKRPLNLKGTQFTMPTPPDTDQSSNASPTVDNAAARDVSPAPSCTTLSSIETMSSMPPPTSTDAAGQTSSAPTTSTPGQPPKKKRKLTPSEKIEQLREKEAKAAEKAAEKAQKEAEKARKEAEKAEEKARKDEEKVRKDEEKRVKDEEKRKKAEEREAVKREKEHKEEVKVQEKLKKERAQMRLGAFFQKPITPAKDGADEATFGRARRKSLSLEPFDAVADQIRRSESPCKDAARSVSVVNTPAKPVVPDYHRYFLPFQLQTYTSMAAPAIPIDLDAAQDMFDQEIGESSTGHDSIPVHSSSVLERHFTLERQISRGRHLSRIRKLFDQIHGRSQQPVDPTTDELPSHPMSELQSVSRRHIAFESDVRPAYFGTYTKIDSPRVARQLARNPFTKARTDTDYDYDSELEWEEPEEGEDLLDEDDDEAESQGDVHEMDEFLDDEDDSLKSKRKVVTGDLVPTHSGLCWEDDSRHLVASVEGDQPLQIALRGMRMGILLPGLKGSTIDPFSKSYWQGEQPSMETTAPAPVATSKTEPSIPSDELMPPPSRAPLQPRLNSNGTLDHLFTGTADGSSKATKAPASTQASKPGRKPLPKTLSKEDMDEFKGFVVGSHANKADLLKELKTR